MSQPQASGLANIGYGQTAASALGVQMAQLGQMYASRGLSIPPTLEIRPGYRFVVMVTKDMVFPSPWRTYTSPESSQMDQPFIGALPAFTTAWISCPAKGASTAQQVHGLVVAFPVGDGQGSVLSK